MFVPQDGVRIAARGGKVLCKTSNESEKTLKSLAGTPVAVGGWQKAILRLALRLRRRRQANSAQSRRVSAGAGW